MFYAVNFSQFLCFPNFDLGAFSKIAGKSPAELTLILTPYFSVYNIQHKNMFK